MKKANGDITDPARVSISGSDIKVMAEPIGSLDPSNLGALHGEIRRQVRRLRAGQGIEYPSVLVRAEL